jgi:hypothetical protein
VTSSAYDIASSDLLSVFKALESTGDVQFLKNSRIDFNTVNRSCTLQKLSLTDDSRTPAKVIENLDEYFERTKNNERKLTLIQLAMKVCAENDEKNDYAALDSLLISSGPLTLPKDVNCLKKKLHELQPESSLGEIYAEPEESCDEVIDTFQNFHKLAFNLGSAKNFQLERCTDDEIIDSKALFLIHLKSVILSQEKFAKGAAKAIRDEFKDVMNGMMRKVLSCVMTDFVATCRDSHSQCT